MEDLKLKFYTGKRTLPMPTVCPCSLGFPVPKAPQEQSFQTHEAKYLPRKVLELADVLKFIYRI